MYLKLKFTVLLRVWKKIFLMSYFKFNFYNDIYNTSDLATTIAPRDDKISVIIFDCTCRHRERFSQSIKLLIHVISSYIYSLDTELKLFDAFVESISAGVMPQNVENYSKKKKTQMLNGLTAQECAHALLKSIPMDFFASVWVQKNRQQIRRIDESITASSGGASTIGE